MNVELTLAELWVETWGPLLELELDVDRIAGDPPALIADAPAAAPAQ